MKKIIVFLLLFAVLLEAIPTFVVNAESGLNLDTNIYISSDGKYKYKMDYEDYYYDEYNEFEGDYEEKLGKRLKGVCLLEYVGAANLPSKYSVPISIDGYMVSSIGQKAFIRNNTITDLVINNSGINIGYAAFLDCKKLKSIVLNSPYGIGEKAFYGCQKLKSIRVKQKACYTLVAPYAFYNCRKLKSAYVSCLTEAEPYSFGYYYDKKSKSNKKVSSFKFRIKGDRLGTDNINYAYENNIKCVCYLSSTSDNINISSRAGEEYWLKINGKSVKGWKSTNSDVVKITNTGKVSFLQSGRAAIKVKLKNGKIFKRKYEIIYNHPKIESKEITVKVGKISTTRIVGKVNSIDWTCKNKSKIVKLVSPQSASTIKVKGLKKGTTTLRIKVNGVVYRNLKVKVK
ncbi:MAG: leucine-rich repeat protein [Ruminococcus sp.]|nr:leucine-rich repeat protein [Ruminococcus sp.]